MITGLPNEQSLEYFAIYMLLLTRSALELAELENVVRDNRSVGSQAENLSKEPTVAGESESYRPSKAG